MKLKRSSIIIFSSLLLLSSCSSDHAQPTIKPNDTSSTTKPSNPLLIAESESDKVINAQQEESIIIADKIDQSWKKAKLTGYNGQYDNKRIKLAIVDSGIDSADPLLQNAHIYDKTYTRAGFKATSLIGKQVELSKHGTINTFLALKNAPLAKYYAANPIQATLSDGVTACEEQENDTSCMRGDTLKALEVLSALGVPIINNSYGPNSPNDPDDFTWHTYWSDITPTQKEYELGILRTAVKNNSLLLFAVGNEGRNYTNGLTRAPLEDKQGIIENGYIAVTSQQKEDTFAKGEQYTDLFEDGLKSNYVKGRKDSIKIGDWYRNGQYSQSLVKKKDINGNIIEVLEGPNRCGETAEYCLAAPSTIINDIFAEGFSVLGGTSHSTAYASGVAADVLSRYPWMSNKNLKEVLLGTAVDLLTDYRADTIGIDQYTGWGMINPIATQKGYKTFAWGQSELNIPIGVVSHFDHNIVDTVYAYGKIKSQGKGGFVKTGKGILVLNGQNSFKGGADIKEGEVVINGRNLSQFSVGNKGILRSGDKANQQVGTLINNGKVINHQPQKLTVTGDYTQSKSGVLELYIGSQLYIKGQANLDGILDLTGVNYASKAGINNQVLQAEGGLNHSKFALVKSSTGKLIDIKTSYKDNKTVEVYARRKSIVAVAAAEKANKQDEIQGKKQQATVLESALSDIDQQFTHSKLSMRSLATVSELINAPTLSAVLYQYNPDIYLNTNLNQVIEQVSLNNRFVSQLNNSAYSVWLNSNNSWIQVRSATSSIPKNTSFGVL